MRIEAVRSLYFFYETEIKEIVEEAIYEALNDENYRMRLMLKLNTSDIDNSMRNAIVKSCIISMTKNVSGHNKWKL